jgi:1-phosphatidylinositol-4-phosphate 5-kinase
MMKTIPYREFEKMRSVLKDYYNHIKSHPDSLIIRFYGLHQVKWIDKKGKE